METQPVGGTAHPIWGAHFLFELSDLPRDDVLIVVRDSNDRYGKGGVVCSRIFSILQIIALLWMLRLKGRG